ncbi:hypothetical protein BOTBODRAFT_579355 [Botryobasidium botryosum FD-172 SS1]|uniref:Secreted protein n=1 Tax=Botryobasidium botryosum (strain FD-172 SS1) TaxID=930990 RepID=A0A067MPF8_BOTB1|nr:hypothetical protein BOTBODRAFT_579355 [Botryobasidium botryosum FD-172 SS1]
MSPSLNFDLFIFRCLLSWVLHRVLRCHCFESLLPVRAGAQRSTRSRHLKSQPSVIYVTGISEYCKLVGAWNRRIMQERRVFCGTDLPRRKQDTGSLRLRHDGEIASYRYPWPAHAEHDESFWHTIFPSFTESPPLAECSTFSTLTAREMQNT